MMDIAPEAVVPPTRSIAIAPPRSFCAKGSVGWRNEHARVAARYVETACAQGGGRSGTPSAAGRIGRWQPQVMPEFASPLLGVRARGGDGGYRNAAPAG